MSDQAQSNAQAELAYSALPKSDRIRLSRRAVGRVLIDILVRYLLIALAMILVSRYPTTLAVILACIVTGTSQYALFVIGHDGIHGNLHGDPKWNDAITRWGIMAPLCMALPMGRASHLSHHRMLGTPKDPDRYLHTLEYKTTKFRFLLFLAGVGTFARTVGKASRDMYGASSTIRRSKLPVAFAQLAIIAVLHALGLAWWYPVLWLLPIYCFVFVPNEVRAFCEHAEAEPSIHAAHDLVTYRPPWWERQLFSPMNMNYHAEHHLWPSIPYYRLPQVHMMLAARCPQALVVRRSYAAFVWQYARSLPWRGPARSWATPTPVADQVR